MKLIPFLLLPLATLLSWTASAQTTKIPILNPNFDEDELSCVAGSLTCWVPSATGWVLGPQTGPEKVSTQQYPSAPPGGFYVMAIGYTNTTGSMLQTLGDTVQANTTYVLKIVLGARADVPFTGYVASLMAGNVTLAYDNTVVPVGGTFKTDVIVYNSRATPAQLGKPLQIFVKGFGTGQVNVASVSLTATAD
jgi:hypothetical protein